jgi:hypothetical protein
MLTKRSLEPCKSLKQAWQCEEAHFSNWHSLLAVQRISKLALHAAGDAHMMHGTGRLLVPGLWINWVPVICFMRKGASSRPMRPVTASNHAARGRGLMPIQDTASSRAAAAATPDMHNEEVTRVVPGAWGLRAGGEWPLLAGAYGVRRAFCFLAVLLWLWLWCWLWHFRLAVVTSQAQAQGTVHGCKQRNHRASAKRGGATLSCSAETKKKSPMATTRPRSL